LRIGVEIPSDEERLMLLVDGKRAARVLGGGGERPSPEARPPVQRAAPEVALGDVEGPGGPVAPIWADLAARDRGLEPLPSVPEAQCDIHALRGEDTLLREQVALLADVHEVGGRLEAAGEPELRRIARGKRIAKD